MKKLYLFITLCIFSPTLFSQVVINEVSSAGISAFRDEDGDAEDWIEFYNAGSQPVDLAGYTISCAQSNREDKWVFPQLILQPGEHFTLFCSGKDRRDFFDHWEVPIYPQSPTRFFPGLAEPPANWKDPAFNDGAWGTSMGPVGYGDGDDTTVIAPFISVYQRYAFNVADTSKVVLAALLADFDDGFVAYLNGKEIARANLGSQGFPPPYNMYAFDEHEAVQYQNGGWSGLFFVPSAMLDSMILPGNNVLAIQAHSHAGGMDDLTMIPALLIGIVDTNVTYFPFPAEVHLHTDFSLDGGGQKLTLYNAQGTIVDEQTFGQVMMDHSRGRQPDGAASWCLFDQPTPDTTNYSASCFAGYGPAPVISLAPGFYTGTQVTTISATMPGNLYWTYDGSDPTSLSPVYSGAITVGNTQVIRARLYPSDPSYLPGPAAAATYFVNENVTLPVVSVITDPANLFDPNFGIYVIGTTADTLCSDVPFSNANFWQGWERPANVEFYDKDKTLQFAKPVSVKIQGNWSKMHPQKGLTVKCDENYGGSPIDYRLFPDKPSTKYSSFNLRNAGTDFNRAHFRDRMLHEAVKKPTALDIMDGFACVVFINGQYWGVYELRERQDRKYLENNSGVDDDNVDFLEFDGSVIAGDNKDFFNTVLYVATADMTQQAAYDSAAAMIDIANFCDYFITETYAGNTDWLGYYTNNIKFWKPHEGPGKWRYILWDTDLAFQSDTLNTLALVLNPPTQNPHSLMLNALLTNDSFRVYFINRYADLLNTTFYNMNMVRLAESFYTEMAPEMPRHYSMWGTGSSPYAPVCIQVPMDTSDWRLHVDILEYILYVRPYYVFGQVQDQFGMTGIVNVGFETFPAGAGTIHLNTITPDSLPWNGSYFNGNPITMTATPAPGYRFSHWESQHVLQQDHYSPVLRTNVDSSDVFTAHFEALEPIFNVYPNPFYDDLTLYYELPETGMVTLRVYDLTGRLITELLPSNLQQQGAYTMHVSAAEMGLAGGMYLFELRTPSLVKTHKIICGRPKP